MATGVVSGSGGGTVTKTVYSGYSAGWKPSGSDYTKKYRAKLVYSITETLTTLTITAHLYVDINSTVNADYTGYMVLNETRFPSSGNWSCSTKYGKDKTVSCGSAQSVTINKTTSEQSIDISGSVRSSNGSWTNVWKTATATITVPPISYEITYDANGGTDAPAAQSKQHGIDLTLSGSIPTRAGYDFQYWNTAADGTGTSFGSEDDFDIDADTVLYAIWHLSFVPPVIEDLRAYRVANGESGYDPDVKSNGTKCYADFNYTPPVSGGTPSITFTFGSSDITVVGTSGTTKYAYSADSHLPTTSKENVMVTIAGTDYLGNPYSYSYSTYISVENYVFDAFKGTSGVEEYQSFAVGGMARDFSNSDRSDKGNFDIYMDVGLVLNEGVSITDDGTALTVTKTGQNDTDDYLLAKAIVEAFSYQDAKDILEV